MIIRPDNNNSQVTEIARQLLDENLLISPALVRELGWDIAVLPGSPFDDETLFEKISMGAKAYAVDLVCAINVDLALSTSAEIDRIYQYAPWPYTPESVEKIFENLAGYNFIIFTHPIKFAINFHNNGVIISIGESNLLSSIWGESFKQDMSDFISDADNESVLSMRNFYHVVFKNYGLAT